MTIIGKRIKIIGNHPHTGENGTVDRVENIYTGQLGYVIKLENCPHNVEECFVFSSKNILPIGSNGKKYSGFTAEDDKPIDYWPVED